MSRLKKKALDAYHHGDLREALVEAAMRALERQSVEGLSLRALGRTLGVSPRAPYRHFETKEELLAAVAVKGLHAFRERLETRLLAADKSPLMQLQALAETYVTFALERPAAFGVMYARYATLNEGAPALVQARAEAHQSSQDIVRRAQAAGLLRDGDPMHIALVLWSSMHGLAVLLTEGQLGRFDRPVDAAKLANMVSAWILRGIGC
jgi:AcrR family transcriptional regulator